MRLVLLAAEVLGAKRLIDITGAHVDSCLYHGQAALDFVERLAAGGARVACRPPSTSAPSTCSTPS